jgi:hypothetical protein
MLTHNSPPSFVAAELHGARRQRILPSAPTAPHRLQLYAQSTGNNSSVYRSTDNSPLAFVAAELHGARRQRMLRSAPTTTLQIRRQPTSPSTVLQAYAHPKLAHNLPTIEAHNWPSIEAHNWPTIETHNWPTIEAHNWPNCCNTVHLFTYPQWAPLLQAFRP